MSRYVEYTITKVIPMEELAKLRCEGKDPVTYRINSIVMQMTDNLRARYNFVNSEDLELSISPAIASALFGLVVPNDSWRINGIRTELVDTTYYYTDHQYDDARMTLKYYRECNPVYNMASYYSKDLLNRVCGGFHIVKPLCEQLSCFDEDTLFSNNMCTCDYDNQILGKWTNDGIIDAMRYTVNKEDNKMEAQTKNLLNSVYGVTARSISGDVFSVPAPSGVYTDYTKFVERRKEEKLRREGMEMYKHIKGVILNKKKGVTTVTWDDGEVTMVKLKPGDEWDDQQAIDECILKKMFGTNSHHKKEIGKVIAKARIIGEKKDDGMDGTM